MSTSVKDLEKENEQKKKTKLMDIDGDFEHLRCCWFRKGEGEWQMGNLPFGG